MHRDKDGSIQVRRARERDERHAAASPSPGFSLSLLAYTIERESDEGRGTRRCGTTLRAVALALAPLLGELGASEKQRYEGFCSSLF